MRSISKHTRVSKKQQDPQLDVGDPSKPSLITSAGVMALDIGTINPVDPPVHRHWTESIPDLYETAQDKNANPIKSHVLRK
jgi:hypothetical protein